MQNLPSFPPTRESTGWVEWVAVILALRQYPQGERTGIDRYGAALPRFVGYLVVRVQSVTWAAIGGCPCDR